MFFIYSLITMLACLAMSKLPSLAFITAIFWGALFIMGGIYLRTWQMMVIFLSNLMVVAYVNGLNTVWAFTAFFGLPALGMSLLTLWGFRYYRVRRWGIWLAVLGVSLYMVALFAYSGTPWGQEIEQQMSIMVNEAMRNYDESGLAQTYKDFGVTRDQVQASGEAMVRGILHHLPAIFYLQAIMAAFLMVWLASIFSTKVNNHRLKRKPFAHEIMPWELVWLVNVGLSLLLVGWKDKDQLYYMGSNLLVIMIVICVYFGLASMLYRLQLQKYWGSNWIKATLLILALLFPLAAIGFLCIIGMFDSLLDLRNSRTGQEE